MRWSLDALKEALWPAFLFSYRWVVWLKTMFFFQGVTEHTLTPVRAKSVWVNAEGSKAQKNIKFDATLWGGQHPSS